MCIYPIFLILRFILLINTLFLLSYYLPILPWELKSRTFRVRLPTALHQLPMIGTRNNIRPGSTLLASSQPPSSLECDLNFLSSSKSFETISYIGIGIKLFLFCILFVGLAYSLSFFPHPDASNTPQYKDYIPCVWVHSHISDTNQASLSCDAHHSFVSQFQHVSSIVVDESTYSQHFSLYSGIYFSILSLITSVWVWCILSFSLLPLYVLKQLNIFQMKPSTHTETESFNPVGLKSISTAQNIIIWYFFSLFALGAMSLLVFLLGVFTYSPPDSSTITSPQSLIVPIETNTPGGFLVPGTDPALLDQKVAIHSLSSTQVISTPSIELIFWILFGNCSVFLLDPFLLICGLFLTKLDPFQKKKSFWNALRKSLLDHQSESSISALPLDNIDHLPPIDDDINPDTVLAEAKTLAEQLGNVNTAESETLKSMTANVLAIKLQKNQVQLKLAVEMLHRLAQSGIEIAIQKLDDLPSSIKNPNQLRLTSNSFRLDSSYVEDSNDSIEHDSNIENTKAHHDDDGKYPEILTGLTSQEVLKLAAQQYGDEYDSEQYQDQNGEYVSTPR